MYSNVQEFHTFLWFVCTAQWSKAWIGFDQKTIIKKVHNLSLEEGGLLDRNTGDDGSVEGDERKRLDKQDSPAQDLNKSKDKRRRSKETKISSEGILAEKKSWNK